MNDEVIKELQDAIDSEIKYGDMKYHYNEVMRRIEAFHTAINALELCDKIIAQLDDEEEFAYADFESYANEYGFDECIDDFFHRGIQRAIEVIKKGLKK